MEQDRVTRSRESLEVILSDIDGYNNRSAAVTDLADLRKCVFNY